MYYSMYFPIHNGILNGIMEHKLWESNKEADPREKQRNGHSNGAAASILK